MEGNNRYFDCKSNKKRNPNENLYIHPPDRRLDCGCILDESEQVKGVGIGVEIESQHRQKHEY